MNDNITYGQLKPGLLIKNSPQDSDIFLVVKNKKEITIRNISTGDDFYPEAIEYIVVGKERNENILISMISWGCREEFPMEHLKDLLEEQSNNRRKTYVSFPDDGSDSYMAVFTSIFVTDAEAYYLFLKSHGYLFGGNL